MAGAYLAPRGASAAERALSWAGWLAAAVATLVALGLGVAALLPGVGFWDTGEFQTVTTVLGTAHPTGFPAYVILGWLATIVLQPLGEPAFRINLLSAILVALAAGSVAILVRWLTGRAWLGLAAGLLLATAPTAWSLATHADAHTLHLALLGLLLCLLVGWEERRRSAAPHADRWLVAATATYGVALANHTLALLFAPGIGLFVLAVEPRILLRPRFVAGCVALLVGVTGALYLELPIRAAMHAPLVYARPDTLAGFQYVVLAEQFRGSLQDPFRDPAGSLRMIVAALGGEYGPLLPLLPLGFLATAWWRPRFALLTAPTFVITCWFAASYVNAEIDRYYLGPVLIGLAWIAVLVGGLLGLVEDLVWPRPAGRPGRSAVDRLRLWPLEIAAAALLLAPTASVLGTRYLQVNERNDTAAADWLGATLDRLPHNAVVISWWSYSTPLWYGQLVEGLRPDIWIVDDRTRLDEHLGEVSDVVDAQLGHRPVFLIRPANELAGLAQRYRLSYVDTYPGLEELVQVTGRLASASSGAATGASTGAATGAFTSARP